MKYIQGKINKPKIKLKTVLIIYGVACLLMPSLLFGTLNTVNWVVGSFAKSYKYEMIKHTKGSFALDLYRTKENWQGAIKGMNPKNWVK